MDDRALMQMALDALQSNQPVNYCMNNKGEKFPIITEDPFRYERNEKTIKALRDRLAQPEPEPYNPMENNVDYERGFIDGRQDQMRSSVDKAVNRMARREWVGLTDGEIYDIREDFTYNDEDFNEVGFAKAIEAKLKEVNNG
jgi:hypothetical protein